MIYVISAGRSGSAWLCAVFSALGLKVRHEMHPGIENPDVVADTSWIWTKDSLLNRLGTQNALRITDSVIFLERDRADIEESIEKLIGKRHNWDRLFKEWDDLKEKVWRMTHTLRFGAKVKYEHMFEPRFEVTLRHILSSTGHRDKLPEVARVLDFFRHLRITNRTSEEETIQSYGYGIGN